jgi:glutathione S-transferase
VGRPGCSERVVVLVRRRMSLECVDVETARNASGVRLVILAGGPSPWSQAAKSILEYKRIPALLVRAGLKDEAVRAWTGISNAPVLMYEKETPRSGWAEILTLAERLRPELPLIPNDPRDRVLHFGWSHEILGEDGLAWNFRLITVDAALADHSELAFPTQAARYLARRYGHSAARAAFARARAVETLALLAAQLRAAHARGHRYFFGELPTALDIYLAVVMNICAPLPLTQCPVHPIVRAAHAWLQSELGDSLAPNLVEHRDHMYGAHLSLPLEL